LAAIEKYTGTEVEKYTLDANEYAEILKDKLDPDENWIKLMKDNETENWD